MYAKKLTIYEEQAGPSLFLLYKNLHLVITNPIILKLTGADDINISGLLVKESRLQNPKKLGNFKK
jgi:hypothetical protein